jgi:GT2 family glycosyltransferase
VEPVVSVLIPTMPVRESHLRGCIDALTRTTTNLDVVVELDEGTSNWGTKIAKAARRANGDYLFLGADDIEVLPGWWQAASAVCDRGMLPAPRVLRPDGRVESCGDWGADAEDGTPTAYSRFPFLSREQWDAFGPTLPVHYSDRILGFRASRAGVDTVVCRAFSLIHHWAMEGRIPNAVAYHEMRDAEIAEGFDRP